ncbi:nucleoside-triphosphatase [Chloroflexota bacterium]
MRINGVRRGFKLVTLDGQSMVLAHVTCKSPRRVSRYGADVQSFENVGIKALVKATEQHQFVVIDEIGKMELFSEKFKNAVLQVINSDKIVLGTIMLNSHPWPNAIKQMSQVHLIELTPGNRAQALEQVLGWLRGANLLKEANQ